MSFFNQVKKFANDLMTEPRCAVGLHSIDWQYVSDRSCNQSGKCSRPGCPKSGHEFTRSAQHVFGDWYYLHKGDCTMERNCRRECGYPAETKIEHDWAPEAYSRVDKCTVETICRRNSEHRRHEVKHRALAWKPRENSSPCYQLEWCEHCRELTGRRREMHDDEASALNCRTCREHRRFRAS